MSKELEIISDQIVITGKMVHSLCPNCQVSQFFYLYCCALFDAAFESAPDHASAVEMIEHALATTKKAFELQARGEPLIKTE